MSRVDRVSVVGAGAMGHGFAAHFALCDLDVTLIDHRRSNLDRAAERIREVVRFHNNEGLADDPPDAVLNRIDHTLDCEAGVADADVVFETVTEDPELKRDLFALLGTDAPDEALLASNTSGIPITDIARGTPDCADRIVGCHWWYPPYLLRPVEVIRGTETSDETMTRAQAFVEQVDRDPIVVERDVPGFVWNRIQCAVVRECMHLASEGVASVEDINRAVRDGYARRTAVIGPFETMDIAGLALFETVAAGVFPHLCDEDEPNALFEEYLQRGQGGVVDGAGFFEYEDAITEVAYRRDTRLVAVESALSRADREY
jgi:3-hydroxybutyryl-CoA dehydrogenase